MIWKNCEYRFCFHCGYNVLHDIYTVNGVDVKFCRLHKQQQLREAGYEVQLRADGVHL